jgi:lipopolysaccharide export system protein LptA
MRNFAFLSPCFMAAGVAAVSALLCVAPVYAQTLTHAFGGLSESSNEPINIQSDLLTLYTDQYALFSGNVTAIQGTATLRARELKVTYLSDAKAGDGAKKEGAQEPTTKKEAVQEPATKKEGGEEPAASTQLSNAKDVNKDVNHDDAPGTKTVKDPIDIQSDWLLVQDKEKYAHFKGNVKVAQGTTRITARELTVDYTGGDRLATSAETSNSGGLAAQITKIQARGDVRALLMPRGSTGTELTNAKPAKATPGGATAQNAASRSGKADLTSASNRASGAMTQNATSSSDSTNVAGKSSDLVVSQGSGPGSNKDKRISKLEAKGEVVITSDKDETTTSDWAIYDFRSDLVTIGGNVVLTQGQNVLKGDRLVMDLKTGESHFENTGNPAAGGRIRALFMPKQEGATSTAEPAGAKPDKPQAILPPAAGDSAKPASAAPKSSAAEPASDAAADESLPWHATPEYR